MSCLVEEEIHLGLSAYHGGEGGGRWGGEGECLSRAGRSYLGISHQYHIVYFLSVSPAPLDGGRTFPINVGCSVRRFIHVFIRKEGIQGCVAAQFI